MLKEILTPHGSMLPQVALVLFVLIALLVIFYIATDRRRDHRKRMESMPLDDGTEIKPTDSTSASARKDAP
jgi:cbb3-type cytochrome oxidase subunit 3